MKLDDANKGKARFKQDDKRSEMNKDEQEGGWVGVLGWGFPGGTHKK